MKPIDGYNACMQFLTAILVVACMAIPASAVQDSQSEASVLAEILKRMAAHEERQKSHLVEYRLHRKFYAVNNRFNKEAELEVLTVFRQPGTFESQVIRSSGSNLIRERVFDKILEAEKEANTKTTKQEVSITPSNYKFNLVGKHDCNGRACYQLQIAPKQKSKFAIAGQIWVDAEDGAIVRIQGSPAKRPSFWTVSTEIERRYKRIEGVWLCEGMESASNIFIGGPSTLKIEYDYLSVETANSIE
jgi:negative regulator of sigma E activity